MTDVLQQARERIKELRESLPPSGPWPPTVGDQALLYAVVEAADAGHLIDTRRMDALAEKGIAIIPEGRSKMHKWEVWHGEIAATAPTFADALAAAEREAS